MSWISKQSFFREQTLTFTTSRSCRIRRPLHRQPSLRRLNPQLVLALALAPPLAGIAVAVVGALPPAELDGLVAVQRGEVAVLDLGDPAFRREVVLEQQRHEGEGERAVEEEVAVSFDGAAVQQVEVDGVRVEGEGAVAEEQGGRGREGVGEVGGVLRC